MCKTKRGTDEIIKSRHVQDTHRPKDLQRLTEGYQNTN